MYYIEDYFTDEIIMIVDNFEIALAICNANPDSQITTEEDEVLYTNIDIPF